MLNIVYSEFLKLKRSYIMAIMLISGIVMSITMAIGNLSVGIGMEFEKFAINIQQMNFFVLNVILFSLVPAYVFSREFADKTASIVYTYPIIRMKIFMAKLITVYLMIFMVYFLQCTSTYLAYYIADGMIPSYAVIVNNVKSNIVSMLFQLLLIPIPILIANITKNIIMPTVYGILTFVLMAFVGMESPYIDCFPLAAPFISAKYFYLPRGINFNHIVISTLVCFLIFMTMCIYEFNKKDID